MKPDATNRLHQEVENQIDGKGKINIDNNDEAENCPTDEEVRIKPDLGWRNKLHRFLKMFHFWKHEKAEIRREDLEQTMPLNSLSKEIFTDKNMAEINVETEMTANGRKLSTTKENNEKGTLLPNAEHGNAVHTPTDHIENETNLTKHPAQDGDAKNIPKIVAENGNENLKTIPNGNTHALIENRKSTFEVSKPKNGSTFLERAKFWKKHESIPAEETHTDQCDQIETEIQENEEAKTSGRKCLEIVKVFCNTFGLIFLAEWGDRSQLATIVMASVNDVGGIILGSISGHTVCSLLAVIVGILVAKKISVRAITIIGGFVFVGFAVASLIMGFEDPNAADIGDE